MRKYLSIIIIALFAVIPDLVLGQGFGHGAAAAYITTSSEPWGQTSNISALNAVYGSSGWNKYIYGTDANNNVSNIFSNTRSLVFIEGGNSNTTAMKNFLDANWSTINTWISGGRTLIVNAATNESLGRFQIGSSGVYSERILTNNMVAYSNASTYPSTTSNVHPLLRTNVTINGVTGDAYYSGNYYGNYVAHNVITGSGLNSIFTVSGQTSQYTLAEKTIGTGRMLVGGLTLPWFITVTAWQPQPQMTRFMYAMLGWVQAVSNPAPTISTVSASSLTVNSVSTGGSSINANGETITAKGVAYSTSQNPTTSSSTVSGGSGTGNFSVNLTNLASNTTYYARAYATSPTGTGYGSQISFTTLPANPTSAASSEGNTICSGTYTNLSVSNAQGTVYWYSDASRTNFVGTGNPRSVNPSATTTYYAFNYNGNFSSGYSSVAITVNQPASQPATASVVVPANADGLTTANLNWGQSTGDGTITYYWSLGTTSTSSYESGYTVRGQTTNPTITATGTGLAKSTGYYLSVKASNSCGTSAYKRSEIFRTNNERIYVAGSNGKVGTTSSGSDASITQYTAYMGDGTAIYAVPDAGYNFVNWSDGVTANPRTDLDATTSYTVTANFAPNRLAFVSQPTETRAGATIGSFAVRYTDTYGNTMTNYNEPITISIQNNPSIGAAGVLSGTTVVTPVNGVATFSDLIINKTGLDYTLKVSAASPVVTTPISSDFDIIPGAVVNYFTVAGIPDPHEAGETTSPKVTAYDAYDNVKYDYTGTIHFSTNNTSVNVNKPTVLPENYTFTSTDQGIKTFTNGVSLKQYGGIYWVKVNDVVVTSAVGQQSDISVTSASLNYYTIKANSNYPAHNTDNNILAGTSFSITAYLYDEYGNLKEDYTGDLDVTLISNASPSPLGNTIVIPAPGLRTFTAGISTISGFTLYNAQETPTITIVETLTGSVGTTPAITVWPEVLDNFYVQENPAQNHGIGGVRVTATQPFDVKVTARDQYNNIKRDYLGRIRFKSSDDNIVDFPDGLQQFAAGDAGIRTFSNAVTIPTTGTYWVRVGDSPDAFKVGELQNIVAAPAVQNAEQSELKFTSYPLVTLYPSSPALVAGDFISVTITPRDAGGNLLCDCKNVAVYLNGVDKHRNGTPVDGVPALVSIPVTDNHDGTYTASVRVSDMSQTNQITASVNGTTVSTTLQVDITEPDVPSLIVSTITPASGSITTDENTLVTLQLKDQFGNNRTTNDGTITFSTTEGRFGANNGTATNFVATYAGSGVYTATLYASYNASTHGVGIASISASADFTNASHTDGNFSASPSVAITEGLPSLLTSTITTGDEQISTDETSLITVQLKDHLGNMIQNDRGAVTLYTTLGALGSSAGGLSITTTYASSGSYTATLYGNQNLPVNGVGIADLTANFVGAGAASAVSGYLNDGAATPSNTVEQVVIGEGIPDVTKIDISVADANITADGSTTVTVQLKDQFENLIVNNRGIVTLSVSPIGVIGNGTNTGTTNIAAVYQSNGAYTATFKLDAFGVGTANITGTFSGTAISDDATVTVTPGVATQLAMYTQPAHITTDPIAGVVFSTQPQVSVQDQWGNIVTSDQTTEITAVRGATGSTNLLGTLTATVTNGIATFSGMKYEKAENMNIAYSVTTGLTSVTSNTLSVVHNVPSYMTISGNGAQIAGASQTITVRVYDAYGNAAIRFDGGKSLFFSGAGVSPAPPYNPTIANTAFGTATNLIFIDGVAAADMVLYKEELAYVVASHADATYSDSYTGATNLSIAAAHPSGLSVIVSQAQAAYLAITGSATQEAGTSQSITVTAYDTYNNVATYYTGTKQIRFAGASVSNAPSTSPSMDETAFGNDTELEFTNGVATASMWLFKSENALVTATDYTSGSAGITTPNDNTVGQTTYIYKLPVAVSPAAASYLAVTGAGTQTAGASQTVTVTAYDPWNNVAAGYTGSKSISFNGASLSPSTPKSAVSPIVDATAFGTATSMNFASGVASGAMMLTKVETAYVKASDGALTTSDTYDLEVAVSHAAENYFAVTGSPTQVAGVSQEITITMYDAYNNIATGYSGDKSLTFSGASASFYPNSPKIGNTAFGSATTVTFVSGIASGVSMTLYDAADATQDALVNVSNGSQTATSLELVVNVAPNSATNLRLDTQPSAYVRAGDVLAQQPVVSIRDAYGNIVTTDNATTITASRNAGTVSETLHGTVTKTAVNGVVSYTDLNYRLMETINLDFVSNPELTTVTSGNIVVDHNATAKYVFTTIPEFIYAGGQRGAYVVTRYDAHDNLVNNVVNGDGSDANSAETVYLYTSGSNTNPFITTFHNALTGGSTITSVNIANNATTAMFWYYSINEGMHTINASDKTNAPPDGDTNIDDAVTTLEVKPAALSHFVVSGVGIYNNATGYYESYYGDPQTITVEAIDIFGNRKINYTGKITFNVTDAESVRGVDYPGDYTFTVGAGADNGIHTFPASLILKPSYKHPDYPTVQEWWVSVVDMAQPSKYGSQTKIYVKKRPILVTAKPQSKIYGDVANLGQIEFIVTNNFAAVDPTYLGANPTPTTYCNDEKVTATTFTSTTGAPATATVGSYDIVPLILTGSNGFDIANYAVSYANGALTVNKRPVTVTVTAGQNKVYSTADPTFSYTAAYTGDAGKDALVNSDAFTGTLTRTAGEDVATNYAINTGSLDIYNGQTDKSANYDITFVSNDFAITPWPLVLSSISAANKTYDGTDDATLTFSDNRPNAGDDIVFAKTADFSDKNVNWVNNVASTKTVTYSVAINGGTHGGNYIFSSASPNTSGATTSWTGTAIATISQRAINVTAQADSKVYDGNTSSDETPMVDALQTGDTVTTSGSQTFDTRHQGTGKTITPAGVSISDDNSGNNYAITYVTNTSGEISKRLLAVSVTGDPEKVYDGLTNATLAAADYIITNVVDGESVSISETAGSYDSKNVGTSPDRTVTVALTDADYVAGNAGTELSNYTLPSTATGAGTITVRTLTFSNFVADNKMYDGTTAATNTGFSDNRVTNDLLTFTYDASFADKHASNGKNVNFSNISISGGVDQNNYTLAATSGTATANISKRTINVTAQTDSKVYDGNTTSTVLPVVDALQSDDALTFAGIQTFDNKNFGTGKVLTPSATVIDDDNSGNNYAITYVTNNTGEITKRDLAVTVDANQKKTYGESNPAAYTYSITSGTLATGDEFTGALSRDAGENVGEYTVNKNTLSISEPVNGYQGSIVVSGITNDGYEELNGVYNYVGAYPGNTGYHRHSQYANAIIIWHQYSPTQLSGSLYVDNFNGTTGTLAYILNQSANTLFTSVGADWGHSQVIPFTEPYQTMVVESNSNMESNYNFTFVNTNKFEIEKRPVTLTAANQTKTYGKGPEWASGDDYWTLGSTAFTVSTSGTGVGMATGESITGVAFSSTGEAKLADVGTYAISITPNSETGAGGFALGNYNVSYEPATLTVEKRTLTLSNFGADSKYYDGNTTATGIGFNDNRIPGDNLAFYREAYFENSAVGNNKNVNYSNIAITGGLDKDNYTLATTAGVALANVLAKPVTVTIAGVNREYDGTTSADVILSGNFVAGDDVSLTYGSAQFSNTSVGDGKTVTVTGIALSGTKADQYSLASASGTTTANITPISRTIEVDGLTSYTYNGLPQGPADATISVGSGAITYSYSGTGTTTYASSNTAPVNAGTYQVVAMVASDGNYNQATSSAFNFTINKAPLTVTAEDKTVTYGDAIPALTYTITGFVNNEVEANVTTGSPALSTSYTSATSVTSGPVTISAAVGTLESANYSFVFIYGEVAINKAASTIAATGTTTYIYSGFSQGPSTSAVTGSTGSVTYSYSGTGTTIYASSNTAPVNAGTYQVVAMVASDGNYNQATSSAFNFTINKAPLTVTAEDKTVTYGDAIPALTYTITGFVNNEVEANVTTGSPALSTSYTSATSVTSGPVTISAAVGTLESANYSFVFIYGEVAINKAASTIAATGTTTYIYSGFSQGPSTSAVTGSTGAVTYSYSGIGSTIYSVSSTAPAAAGTYQVIATVAADDNYNGSTSAAYSFTINKKELTVTANGDYKAYNGLAYEGGNGVSYSGFVNGETSAVLGGNLSYTGSSQNAVSKGTYVITPQGLNATNYTISFVDGDLEIGNALLMITANNDSRTYDGQEYSGGNGVTYSGFVEGDDEGDLTGTLTYAGTSQGAIDAGTYLITPGGLSSNNYDIQFINGSLTIDPKTIIVINSAVYDKIYDGNTEAEITGATLSGLVSGDVVTIENEDVGTFAQTNAGTNVSVSVNMSLAGVDAENYALTQPMGLSADITAKTLTIGGSFTTSNKAFDGTTTATISTNNLVLNGLIGSDVVNLNAVANFIDAESEPNKTVSLINSSITGTDAGNYLLSFAGAPTAIASISVKVLTLSGTFTAFNKIYDGTNEASINNVALKLNGIETGDDVALVAFADFANENVGTGKTVSLTGSSLTGEDADNYVLSLASAPTATANITAKPLTIAAPTLAASKVYNGSAAATVTAGILSGVETGDVVSVIASASYADETVGTGKTITVVYTLSGTDAGNYIAPANYTVNTGTITAKPLTIAAPTLTASKVYNGSAAATVTAGTLSGVETGDVVSLIASASYADETVGTGKTITVVYTLSGTDADNYIAPANYTVNTGTITAKPLTIAAPTLTASKVYNGSAAATVT
ncbi:beta strand repeat-containing protein, partial [Acinetobacter sp.]|uniref:beta strand repeat-containing protein n=1 Tax=Acinetobacter sp. TaxID=472 RepID=UPI003D06F9DC